MLFALRQPLTLVGLLLGFAVGCFLRVASQQALNGGLRSAGKSRFAGVTAPRAWLDPYGVLAAVVAGVGWSPRPAIHHRAPRQRVWLMVVAAVAVHGVLAAAGFAAFVAAGGHTSAIQFIPTIDVLHGSLRGRGIPAGQQIALGFGFINLSCGVLALLPVPPLELGVALWSTLPKSPGARKLAYRMLDEQWSVAAVLLLLIVPLAGEEPALLLLVNALSNDVTKLL